MFFEPVLSNEMSLKLPETALLLGRLVGLHEEPASGVMAVTSRSLSNANVNLGFHDLIAE